MKVNGSLVRISSNGYQSQSILNIYDKTKSIFSCKALELPNLRNQKRISRIPTGRYLVKKRHSDKYGHHYHVTNVPNRTWILFHSGNYNTHTQGCIILGKEFVDINNDGQLDVTSSKDTMKVFNHILPESFYLTVTDLDY